jgi:hypothetical protein
MLARSRNTVAAFNTPQFDWALNHVGRRPKPVPPIFQPELAAEAIVWAARHPRREVLVGWPAWKAVMGNKLFPALADRLLAESGYSGQITVCRIPQQYQQRDRRESPRDQNAWWLVGRCGGHVLQPRRRDPVSGVAMVASSCKSMRSDLHAYRPSRLC